jgi:LmbE family N-acetylglucosaminyl deacetylase
MRGECEALPILGKTLHGVEPHNEIAIVSPHPDDAVFSCGGTMALLSEQERAVVVLDMCTAAAPETLSALARAIHTASGCGRCAMDKRLAEDKAALSKLGARSLHLGLADAIYRCRTDGDFVYQAGAALTGGNVLDPESLVEHVQALFADALRAFSGIVFCPLAIGGHVDHVLARRCVERLYRAGCAWTLLYYEDLPYARKRNAFRHIGLHAGRSILVPLEARHIAAKVAAGAEYTSQVRALWGTARAYESYIRASANKRTKLGLPRRAERFWQVGD